MFRAEDCSYLTNAALVKQIDDMPTVFITGGVIADDPDPLTGEQLKVLTDNDIQSALNKTRGDRFWSRYGCDHQD